MLKSSYAQNTITPDLSQPVYMAGFSANKPATSVHDDLWVRVLALWLNDKNPVLLVTVDIIGLSRFYCEQIEQLVTLRSGVVAKVLIAALKRNGSSLDTEKLIATLENMRDLDIGLGTPVSFGQSRHQGVVKVWGTQLDENGRYRPIDLQ